MKQWFLLENEKDYQEATNRFEQIYEATKHDSTYREMQLLALLINRYEKKQYHFPEVDPVEMIKSRMEDLDLKPAHLAQAYGDKGTVSKVLNYKQPLSLTMIRLFSKLLRIPAEFLIKEYDLKNGAHTTSRQNNIRKPRQPRKRTDKRGSPATAK